MLGKLFKHEFIYTAKRFIPLYIIGFAAAGVMRLLSEVTEIDSMELTDNLAVMFIYSSLLIAIGMATVVLTIYAMFSSIPRFHKNMFSDEGYLTNTLPVSSYSHVLCKFLTGLVWYIITVLVVALIQFISFGEWEGALISTPSILTAQLTESSPAETILSFYSSVASYSAFILMCYMCDSIRAMSGGKTSAAVFMAIGFVILNGIVLSFIYGAISTLSETKYESSVQLLNVRSIVSSIYYTIVAFAMFFITGRNLKERLNLQ